MTWFFLAIAIFPLLFTPGFYIDLPAWIPVTISREGLELGLESSARLLNILLISLVRVRTTADWMGGLDKLLGPMTYRLPIIRDLLAVSVMAVKFLPRPKNVLQIFARMRVNGALKNYVPCVTPFCNSSSGYFPI